MINEYLSEFFSLARGLTEVCLLWSLLFIIAMDGLSLHILEDGYVAHLSVVMCFSENSPMPLVFVYATGLCMNAHRSIFYRDNCDFGKYYLYQKFIWYRGILLLGSHDFP